MASEQDSSSWRRSTPARRWGGSCGNTGSRHAAPRSSCRTGRRCGSCCSARSSSPSATARAASASWITAVRIAAPRCSSARNEESGLRCVYHGWKFDVDGNASTCRTCRRSTRSPQRSGPSAYKAAERNGIVWAYMGARAGGAAAAGDRAAAAAGAETRVTWAQRECNWLQALEGDIDTSHVGFLHEGKVEPEEYPPGAMHRYLLTNRAPEIPCGGYRRGAPCTPAYRPADAGQAYYRAGAFPVPVLDDDPERRVSAISRRARLGADGRHAHDVPAVRLEAGSTPIGRASTTCRAPIGAGVFDYLPNTTDWYGRWRLAQNAANDYVIDREAQRTRSFTGIEGVHVQDQAVTESMGPLVDRGFEKLAVSDLMLTRTRRRLLRAAQAIAEARVTPPGVDHPEICLGPMAASSWRPSACRGSRPTAPSSVPRPTRPGRYASPPAPPNSALRRGSATPVPGRRVPATRQIGAITTSPRRLGRVKRRELADVAWTSNGGENGALHVSRLAYTPESWAAELEEPEEPYGDRGPQPVRGCRREVRRRLSGTASASMTPFSLLTCRMLKVCQRSRSQSPRAARPKPARRRR